MKEIITLISGDSKDTDIGDILTDERRRNVFAAIKSVGATYKLKALAVGLRPKYRFILADYLEYEGEERLEYSGKEYRVIDTFQADDNTLELTVEEIS